MRAGRVDCRPVYMHTTQPRLPTHHPWLKKNRVNILKWLLVSGWKNSGMTNTNISGTSCKVISMFYMVILVIQLPACLTVNI